MTAPENTVAIVGGTGALGSALALQLARANVNVRIGSRKLESAEEAATRIRSNLGAPDAPITAHTNADAVKDTPIVFLTVPFRAQSENLTALKGELVAEQILVDATVPLAAAVSGKATRTIGVWQGSAAQQAQEMVPEGVSVVSALHSVSAASLAELDEPAEEQDVLVMGKKVDKARVAPLIDLIPGLRAVDGGPLEAARIAEQITALLIGINGRYKTHAGVRFTGLPAKDWD